MAVATTDAYPDRKYEGVIKEVSPEANRQKATVQVKVKILKPDGYLRPEMNASVAFVEKRTAEDRRTRSAVAIPLTAVRDGSVFITSDGRAVRRSVRTGARTSQGIFVEEGLSGGEELILNPPADLKDGDRVRPRKS
jgi:HlyD family secretion protein